MSKIKSFGEDTPFRDELREMHTETGTPASS